MAETVELMNASRGPVAIQISDDKPGIVILPRKRVDVPASAMEREEIKRHIRTGHLRAIIAPAPKRAAKNKREEATVDG